MRVVVTGLAAETFYNYRFTSGAETINGRPRTAPPADADVPVRVALAGPLARRPRVPRVGR